MLATKVWGTMPDGQGLSAAQIAKQLDASLRRLRTDYVDLYQAHRFDVNVPIEETLEAWVSTHWAIAAGEFGGGGTAVADITGYKPRSLEDVGAQAG